MPKLETESCQKDLTHCRSVQAYSCHNPFVVLLFCRAGKPLAAADVENKTKSFFREFASVGDEKEALTCVQEIRDAPKEAEVKVRREQGCCC